MRRIFLHISALLSPLIVLFYLTLQTVLEVNQLNLIGDGEDNFKLSYHLAKDGIISTGGLDQAGNLLPSNLREPLPVVLGALWINMWPALSNTVSPKEMLLGKKIVLLKLQNVVYVAVLLLGIFCLFCRLLPSNISRFKKNLLATLVVLSCYACMHTVFTNNLITEFHAELLIIWFVWAWLSAWASKGTIYYFLAGLLLGLLVLTKAAFMYIGCASVLFFMLFLVFAKYPVQLIFKQSIILIIAFLCITPWLVRNYIQLGLWEHTQRGPVVLLVRAYKNAMTHEEFTGAFYAYAPASLKKIMKSLTGFSAKDRLTGGRLQRLTRFPDGDLEKREAGDEAGAISYYIKATTHDHNVRLAFNKKIADPIRARILADRAIKQEAINKIKADISAHLKTALVFAWRGSWPCNTVDGRWKPSYPKQPMWQEILPFFGLLSMWGILIFGVLKRQVPSVILSILGVSTFTFYTMATHFLPRYSEMMIPLWVVCFFYFVTKSVFRQPNNS